MQFALNEDQVAVRDMALAFAAEKIAPHALRWDEEKHFPVDVMREAATLGMGGIYIREDVGGSAMTRFDAALIFEALATGCPTTSAFISIHNMASWMIDAYGSDTQRHTWLPKLCTMELIASYCLTAPGAGSDAAALRPRAARTFLWRAAAALDRKDADATMLRAMAKRFGTDTGFEVANQALQLHGGYGYLREFPLERIERDLRVHQILEGTNEIMRVIIARELFR